MTFLAHTHGCTHTWWNTCMVPTLHKGTSRLEHCCLCDWLPGIKDLEKTSGQMTNVSPRLPLCEGEGEFVCVCVYGVIICVAQRPARLPPLVLYVCLHVWKMHVFASHLTSPSPLMAEWIWLFTSWLLVQVRPAVTLSWVWRGATTQRGTALSVHMHLDHTCAWIVMLEKNKSHFDYLVGFKQMWQLINDKFCYMDKKTLTSFLVYKSHFFVQILARSATYKWFFKSQIGSYICYFKKPLTECRLVVVSHWQPLEGV